MLSPGHDIADDALILGSKIVTATSNRFVLSQLFTVCEA